MKQNTKLIRKVEFVPGNWYNSLAEISKRKGRLATMADLIKEKNQVSFEDALWQNGGYVSTTLDYAQNQPVILIANNSPLTKLENAKKAVQAHSRGEEFNISQKDYDSHLKQAEKEAKKDPEKRKLFILLARDTFSITSQNYFEVLRFLAQDPKQAEKYLEKLSEKGINELTFYLTNKEYADNQKTPFERQLWSLWLDYGADLYGNGRDLNCDNNGAYGVFPSLGEAQTQKFSQKAKSIESYTPKEINIAARKIILNEGIEIKGLDALILRNLRANKN